MTKDYIRVRVGVGKPEYKSQVADYVLHNFNDTEVEKLETLIDHVVNSCKDMLKLELIEIKSKYSLKSIDGIS